MVRYLSCIQCGTTLEEWEDEICEGCGCELDTHVDAQDLLTPDIQRESDESTEVSN